MCMHVWYTCARAYKHCVRVRTVHAHAYTLCTCVYVYVRAHLVREACLYVYASIRVIMVYVHTKLLCVAEHKNCVWRVCVCMRMYAYIHRCMRAHN